MGLRRVLKFQRKVVIRRYTLTSYIFTLTHLLFVLMASFHQRHVAVNIREQRNERIMK